MKWKRVTGALLAAALVFTAAPVSAAAQFYQRISEYQERPQLNQGELTLYVGESFQLELEGAKVSSWHSSNSKWAVVDENGLVTGKAAGEVNIVAIVSETESYLCRVTVKAPYLSRTESAMYVGNTQTLVLNGATAKHWRSDDTSIAKVNSKGKITAVSAGTTTIYCRDTNGKRYTCKLTVYKKSGNNGATPADIKKQVPYTINKVYDEDTKIYMYYATNGAYGEIPDYSEWHTLLSERYPGSTVSGSGHCVIQYCDGAAAGNYCDYSIYYQELHIQEMGELGVDLNEYYVVDFSHGDNLSNYFSEEQREKVARIGTTRFPKLYKYLGVYDLNGDSWLSKGEIEQITKLTIDAAISDLTGIEYLTSLFSMELNNFTGTEIVLTAANERLEHLNVTLNTSSITIDAPYLDTLYVYTYYQKTDGGYVAQKTESLDVSGCTGASEIYLQGSGVQTLKLPEKSTALKELSLWNTQEASLNFKNYKNLEKLILSYNSKLTKVTLTSNKKLKYVWAYTNTLLKESGIKLPKGVEVEVKCN